MFLFLYRDILTQAELFSQSESYDMGWISLPIIWVYLIGNTLTQYVCIKSVFVLTTECTSLTGTADFLPGYENFLLGCNFQKLP